MAEQPFTVIDIDVEDDATFDTDTLVVDGANNRVGILVAAPTVTFDVLGTSLMTGTLNVTSNLTLGSGGTAYTFPTTDGISDQALVSDGAGNLTFTDVGPGSVTSVGITAGTGISVSGSPITSSGSMTVTNIGVTSVVAGSNIAVSAATGAVTISSTDQFVGTVTSVATSSGTFVDITGGTITSSGTLTSDLSASGTAGATTFLRGDNTWSTPSGTYSSWTLAGDSGSNQTINDGDTVDIAGGTGIATVASATDTITVTNTGVTSNLAGTGIGVSSATGAVTITNSGVTSIVAGTNISISGATGAVTISSTDQFIGTVTSVGSGTGLSGGPITTSGTLNLDLDSLSASGTLIGTDDLAVVDGTTSAKTQISTIPLSIFNNDSGWTSNTGTVTSVATSSGTFVDVTGGTITGSGTITGDLSASGTASASTFLRGDNTWATPSGTYTSWTLAGDTGTPQAISDGNTATIAGGTGLSTSATATDTLTVVLDDTAVTPGSYTYSSLTVDQQGRLTAASSGSSPGTMDDWTLAGDAGTPQTISDGNTATFTAGSGISTSAGTTDTLTITNTGVTSNVAGTGISVSGATGAVTITNSGVTSIVAGTNVSISGATGAVTINSTDQFVGTVTSVATSSGTFVDITGGTITASGTITGDLSATGTASASTYLRGDNTWATIAGDITEVTAGTGLEGGGTSGAVTLSVDYTGTDNFIDVATDLEGTPIAAADSIVYHDTGDNNVKKGLVSDLPFSSTSGTVTSVAATAGTGISISGSPITTSGTLVIGNTGVTSNVAGTGISVSGATGAVTITNAGVTGVTGGTGIDTTASTGSITLTLDLDELTTTTTSSNADFFSIVNSGAAQFKIAPSDIDLSTFNNDSGWTTNTGTVTSVATSSGTFVDVTGGTITGSGTITGDLSATGTASASTFLRGDNTWATPAGSYSSWTLAGDSGGSQTITDGNTATIAGGTGLSSVASATDTVTLNLDNTAVTAASYTYASITVDAQGRLTAASSGSSPGTMSSWTLSGDSGSSQTISDGDTVDIEGGTGISTVASATDTLTVTNTGVTSNVAGSGISVSGATGAVTITNAGVTSIVAGTNISISGATGAVTISSTDQFVGTVTSVGSGTGLSGGPITSSGTINLDLNSLSASGTLVGTDDLAVVDGTTSAKTQISTIPLSIFSNDAGWTTNTGTVTSVATSSGTFVDVTGGTITATGTITGDLSATGTASASTFLRGDNTWSTPTSAFSDFIISDGSTTQTIADGDTLLFSTGTGVSAVVSATDTLTITNTGVTSAVASTGISVSGATGAVTFTNIGVTSIVAGTNISISGATGAVTISSTDQFVGTVTSVATSSGTFVDVTGGTITASGTITGDLSATGTASASTFLRGDNTWASPAGSFTFDVEGSSGTTETISSGDTLIIAQGTGITSVASNPDKVTITLADTAVTPGSYTYGSFTVDQQGRLTAASSGSSPGTMSSFSLTGDSGTPQTISDGDTVDIAGGTGLSSVVGATDTVTLNLDNTAVSAGSYTYASLTVDAQGRLTAASSGSTPGTMDDWILTGDTGSQTITDGNTVDIAGGSGISTAATATDTLTVTNTGVTSNVAGTGISVSGATGAVTITNSGVTSLTGTTPINVSASTGGVTISSDAYTGTTGIGYVPTGGSASTFLRGDGAWVTPGGSYAFWTLTADSGSNQNILNGNTVDIAGGTGISTVVGATDTVTLTLDNTAVSAGSYTYSSLTVDAQGRLTAASSGAAPGTMSSFDVDGSSGSTQTISNGDTLTIAQGTGITSVASATDTITITNTGVTSIVAGTNVSISGATGAVTINSTDQYVGTVTSVATSSGTFVDITGGTITSSGTITGDLSATGTASASTFLRGDNTWATPTASVGGSNTEILYNDSGTEDGIPIFTYTNTSGSEEVILEGTSDEALMRITQLGTGSAFQVEDSTHTDSSRFEVGFTGSVGIKTASSTAYGLKVNDKVSIADQIEAATGSAAAPSYTYTGDTNTGMFRVGADTLGFSTNGANVFQFGSAGQFGIGGATYGTAGQVLSSGGASAVPTWEDASTGTVTSVATSSGTFVDVTGGTITTTGTITGDLSATGTASASTFLRGDNTWATPAGGGTMSSWTLAGDSGSSQAITDGNTATIAGGTGLSSVASATDTVTLNLDNTAVTAASYTYASLTVDAQGRLTAASSGSTPGTMDDWVLTGDTGSQTISDGNTVDIAGGTGISTAATAVDTLTVTNTGVTSNVAGAGIGVSGATGAVTITNSGVTSIVAGTNVSISGATGAVTINSSDQYTGTVSSVATSSGTFVDITGGTITSTGTITGDLSATGTASSSTFLRGDNTWATPTASVGGSNTEILYNDSGTEDGIPIFTYINTATSEEVILEGTSDQALLRITQLGTGDALLIEDQANPDATPFKIDGAGNVAMGGASYGNKLQVHGDVGFTSTNFYIGGSPGQFMALAGSAASPYYTFNGDTNTGMFQNGADTLGFATAGVNAFQFGSDGQFGIGGATYGTAGQVLSSGGATAVPTWEDASTGTIGGSITDQQIAFGTTTADEIEGSASFLFDTSNNNMQIGLGVNYPRLSLAGNNALIYFKDNTTPTPATQGSIGVSGTDFYIKGFPADTERLRITTSGEWGIEGANYGSSGDVLTSGGSGASIAWATPAGGFTSWTLAGDSGSSQTITDGNTVDIAGGTGISTVAGATDTVTITNTGVTSNVAGSGISVSGATGAVTITNAGVTSAVAGTGIDVSGATGAVTISTDVSDFMTNGVNNRVLTATGTDAMNAEANMTFDGSTLDVLGAARTYQGSTTVFGASATTALTAAAYAGEYLIKTHTAVHTFNLPASFSVGEHYTIIYAPAATTTSGAVTIDAGTDNITWYDGSASVYATSITWTPKAGSAITIIGSTANTNWVAIGTDQ